MCRAMSATIDAWEDVMYLTDTCDIYVSLCLLCTEGFKQLVVCGCMDDLVDWDGFRAGGHYWFTNTEFMAVCLY